MLPGPTHPTLAAPSRAPESEAALEDLGHVVLKDDQNMIIWSQDREAMARAAQSLQALWRSQAPAVAVEHFTGDQRLALLSHINQGIAQMGLAQAMQTPSASSLPNQIAIITNAEQLPASDVQMLQDMTRHLPGLRWRWVLLCLEGPSEQNSAAASSMPPSEPPPQWMAEPVPAALVTPAEPMLTPTEPVDPVAPVAPVAPAETMALADAPALASPTAMPQAFTPTPSGQPAKRQRLAWLGLAAVLVLASWGTWLHFRAQNSTSSSAAQQSAPDAAAPAPAPAPDAATAAAPALEASSVPSASAPADNNADIPDVALRGVRWLTQQSPEFFVLEHGAFQTAAQAQSLIRTRAELANARVLMRKSTAPGGRFVVITGPFRSLDRAQNYKVRENLPPQIQIRKVSDVLQESVGPAKPRP